MNKIILAFLFLIFTFRLQAQEIKRTTATDSSVITTSIYGYTDSETNKFIPTAKITEESFKTKDLVHVVHTFRDTAKMNYEYYTNQHSDKKIGVSKLYNEDGRLEYTIDNDAQAWLPNDTTEYPNYTVLNKMKLKGDSIVRAFYGDDFFRKYVTWNMHSSYYFDSAYTAEPSFAIEWLRSDTKYKYTSATEFYVSYTINYEDKTSNDAIRIIVDRNGKLLPSHGWNENWVIYNTGLENVAKNAGTGLSLITANTAITQAKQHGLKIKGSSKASSSLQWQAAKGDEKKIVNGRFVFIVKQLVPIRKKEHPPKDSIHYREWVVNAWTGEFIEQKDVYERVCSVCF